MIRILDMTSLCWGIMVLKRAGSCSCILGPNPDNPWLVPGSQVEAWANTWAEQERLRKAWLRMCQGGLVSLAEERVFWVLNCAFLAAGKICVLLELDKFSGLAASTTSRGLRSV